MDDNGLVIHLPIRPADLTKSSDSMMNGYHDGPAPYNTPDTNFAQFEGGRKVDVEAEDIYREKFISEKMIDSSICLKKGEQKLIERNIKNIMFEFMDSNSRKEWPTKTNVHCWWCCHPFDTPPCAIPQKYHKGVFHLYGCFCSFNCAAAYNFDKKYDHMWESYSLLHLLYKKMYDKDFKKIIPAPPKEVLKIFGGILSIEEYRENLISNTIMYRIITPPMISIVPKLEENKINVEQIRNRKKYIPVDNIDQQMNRSKLQQLKKSNKSNMDKGNKNTLNAYLNLKKM